MSQAFGFDVYPDMRGLLDAKRVAKQAEAANDGRGGWNNYAAAMQHDYPAGMVGDHRFEDAPALSPCDLHSRRRLHQRQPRQRRPYSVWQSA